MMKIGVFDTNHKKQNKQKKYPTQNLQQKIAWSKAGLKMHPKLITQLHFKVLVI